MLNPLQRQGLKIYYLLDASSRSVLIVWIKAHRPPSIIGWVYIAASSGWKRWAFVLKICRRQALLLLKLRELLGYAERVGDIVGELR